MKATTEATDRNDPALWFLLLERGRQTGDFDLAAQAKRELERLGVYVRYRRSKERRTEGRRHA